MLASDIEDLADLSRVFIDRHQAIAKKTARRVP